MKLNNGVLVAFEGIDGAGKTTQAKMLADRLRSLGLETILTKEPTDGPEGMLIRGTAHSGRLSPEAEFRAFVADRRRHVAEKIQPALERGAAVIVDRYYLSSIAYQGARGISPELIRETNEAFAPVPDLVFLLEIEPSVGLARVEVRDGAGNEFEEIGELKKAHSVFSRLPDEDLNIRRLDATRPIDDLHDTIARALYFGPLFSACCLKSYLSECEIGFCGLAEHCGYPQFGPLAPSRYAAASSLTK